MNCNNVNDFKRVRKYRDSLLVLDISLQIKFTNYMLRKIGNFYAPRYGRKFHYVHNMSKVSIKNIQGPPNNFFFETLKKIQNIFSNFFFYLKVQC